MTKLKIFTDGSVNPKTKIGFGACIVISGDDSNNVNNITVKRFDNSSSTKLELQTIIWALNEVKDIDAHIIIYTDSQNVIGLLNRRNKLEQSNYISGKGKQFANHELYKQFYLFVDRFDIKFIKVKGHIKSSKKNEIDKLFTIVDRASRNALRNYYK